MKSVALRSMTITAAALGLAACGVGLQESDESSDPQTSPAEVGPDAAEGSGEGGSEDGGENGSGNAVEEVVGEVVGGTIPADYHGVWDYVEGTCARESDLRIEVSASEIQFYESTGKVVTALTVGDTVILDLEMSGEGETWTQKSTLQGLEGMDRLVFEADAINPSADPTNIRKRCP